MAYSKHHDDVAKVNGRSRKRRATPIRTASFEALEARQMLCGALIHTPNFNAALHHEYFISAPATEPQDAGNASAITADAPAQNDTRPDYAKTNKLYSIDPASAHWSDSVTVTATMEVTARQGVSATITAKAEAGVKWMGNGTTVEVAGAYEAHDEVSVGMKVEKTILVKEQMLEVEVHTIAGKFIDVNISAAEKKKGMGEVLEDINAFIAKNYPTAMVNPLQKPELNESVAGKNRIIDFRPMSTGELRVFFAESTGVSDHFFIDTSNFEVTNSEGEKLLIFAKVM